MTLAMMMIALLLRKSSFVVKLGSLVFLCLACLKRGMLTRVKCINHH